MPHPTSQPLPTRDQLAAPRESFPVALSRAIDRSGMSLEHLQRKLSLHDVRVSLSTLSYWRRGRTRPERPESLRAVSVIEDVLGLPNGYLISLLGPRKPRGRWASRSSAKPHEALWEGASELTPLLAELNDPGPGELTFLSVREQHFVNRDGVDERTLVHAVIRSEVDWRRTCVVLHHAEPGDSALPVITAASGCAMGKSRTHEPGRFVLSEILLDRTLRVGDTAAFSYEVTWFGTAPSSNFTRAMRQCAREYLLEVVFHPDAVPSSCHQFRRESARHPEVDHGELRLGAFHSVHLLTHDEKSAIVGIRWHW
ncbi:helix-turn-helix domain-containing protein [Actinokineospora sp. HUAS TT18]|uniref:helix-turn-helix domain-containing protein n=1 Tax=Actinokineospora sp. HUAS TT18 TaxID=3447451 RepID=UPI003F51C105